VCRFFWVKPRNFQCQQAPTGSCGRLRKCGCDHRVLDLRKDSNFTLCTIIWGNVVTNVLLTLLSDSVLAGLGAFVFSTIVITIFGEIVPQAYFSRHALRMASRLKPLLNVYEALLFPVAKPTAALLNWWLGREGITLLREQDFRALLARHGETEGAEVSKLEAIGALNFLDLDDIPVQKEGELIDPLSIVTLPTINQRPALPKFECEPTDPCDNWTRPERNGLSLSMIRANRVG